MQFLGSNFYVVNGRTRLRNDSTNLTKRFEVVQQRILQIGARFFLGVSRCRATQNVRRIGGESGRGALNHYRISL